MTKILQKDFFQRPSLTVARELIGKYLVRKSGKETIRLMITEVEVYDGFKDKASHAHRGQTLRNAPMFGEAGVIYVYFTYGMHWMLNISIRETGYPAAILIRGAGEISGPARLTKALRIGRELAGQKLGKKSGLWIEDRDRKIPSRNIARTPRIGIASSGPLWSQKRWRFLYTGPFDETYKI